MSVSLEQLEVFLREPPPRAVPRNILRRCLRHSLGWFGYLFGGIFFGVGLVLATIFFPWRLREELALDLGSPEQSTATIESCQATKMEVNKARVYRVRYQFRTKDGQPIEGTCYVTGKSYAPGESVDVEYLASLPQWNRLQGGHVNAIGYFGVFMAPFPLIGAVVLWLSWGARRRAVGLLRHGIFALGHVQDVQATNVMINNQRRYRVIVDYEAAGQPYVAHYHAYGEEVELARRHQANGEEIGLLYDPDRPERVLFAESLLG